MQAEITPATSYDERARLRELLSLQLLYTPPEERFDRYTRLVANIFDVPIAIISLVDEHRQWSKSVVGLEPHETPREIAFCSHALSYDLLEVPDATLDPRFANNPAVVGAPHLRFYAGAVLRGPSGQPLGTLCLVERRPRTLSSAERERLKSFARLVEQELYVVGRFDDLNGGLHRVPGTAADRHLNKEHLERVLKDARDGHKMVAAVHLNVLDFEELRETHGSTVSDAFLKVFFKRLQAGARGSDIIGRNGTTRFLLCMAGMPSRADIAARVRQIVLGLTAPVQLGEVSWQVKLSAGVSCFPDDAESVDTLLDRARTAAHYSARETEQSAFQFYSRDTHLWASRTHDIAQRLAEAITSGQLRQVYQPIVALNNARLVGVEALARWRDARYGHISPAEFIPLIEADPTMRGALTRWALQTACHQAAEWHGGAGVKVRIAVNIPGAELCRGGFVDLVRATLEAHALPAHQLHLELTEQSLIDNLDAAVVAMQALRADGVQFSVDDFGTGYSSLSYLRKLPLDALKIDRSFIIDIAKNALDHDLTRGIVEIARALDLKIIAEGIETKAQLEALTDLRCQYGQGYLFSHPISAEQLTKQCLRASKAGVVPTYPRQTPVALLKRCSLNEAQRNPGGPTASRRKPGFRCASSGLRS